MTETTTSDAKVATSKAAELWGEVGPVLVFILIYNVLLRMPAEEGLVSKDTALYWATGGLMAGVAVVVGIKLVRREAISPFMLISSAIIGVFGVAGILLQSKLFLYIKPTIVNLMFAATIFGGLAVGRNIWQMLFSNMFDLPDFAWRTLAIRWGIFFVAMALWNEFLWRNFSEAVWANWKLGNIPITMLFMMANLPYTLKHMQEEPAE